MQHDGVAGGSAIEHLVVYKEDVHVWRRATHDENEAGRLRWSFVVGHLQGSSIPMNTSNSSILARLAQAVSTTTRRMFGCTGVYSDGVFFAIVDRERLFFKVDDATRPMYEGMSAFEPNGRTSKNYYEVPDHVVDEPETLREWAIQSIEAARKP